MKLIKLSLVAALAATVMMAEEATSDLSVSANMAMTSNYVWRGMTQTSDAPAIQGGFDVEYKGLYAGVWGSNIAFAGGNETDLYVGYAGEAAGISYDVGFIQYAYSKAVKESNFGETYIGLGYDLGVASVSATYSIGVDTNNADLAADDWEPTDNIELGASVALPSEIGLDITYGMYDKVGDYLSLSLGKSVGKFDLSLAYTAISRDIPTPNPDNIEDEDNIVATIGTSF